MPLAPGTWLGSYEIREYIGSGGMGDVYRANDNKLKREVALKVLPEHFARDPERIARFRREAQLLAQLNHPNIAAIYNFEEVGETRFLVMELVLGETLRERIKRGPLPLEESLDICSQITEALEHAHEKPIIHRDLKPANVKVTPQGQVKVLDFGLAKAFGADRAAIDPHDAPTGSLGGTLKGTILGTPAYMSPEQASGKTVDKRADIWALGCLLYELLTGKQAFTGDTVTEIIASVLKSEPDWTALPADATPNVRVLVKRCLRKDLPGRFRDATDVRIQIEEARSATPVPIAAPVAVPPGVHISRRQAAIVGLAALVLAAIVSLATWYLKPTPPRPVSRFTITLPPSQRLAIQNGPGLALSPDGSHLAYATIGGTQQLYLRALDSLEAKPIPGTEGGEAPFFSPDGQWVGFFANAKLKKVSVSGGAPVDIATFGLPRGESWGGRGTIVIGGLASQPLQQVPEEGGVTQPLTRIEKGEAVHWWPEFLPDGKAVLFAASPTSGDWTGARIAVQLIQTGERRNLNQGGTHPRYAPSGHLVYAQGGNLLAAPFDLQRLALAGPVVPVVEGVLESIFNGHAQYSFSATGTLVYVPGGIEAVRSRLVWVSRNGAEQPLASPERDYSAPRISPDGQRVAVAMGTEIWLYDLTRETLTRFTFEGTNLNPVWTPDGKRIAFQSGRGGSTNLFWQLVDGSGGLERLTTSQNIQVTHSWSPDGQLLAFHEVSPVTGRDIWVLRMSDPATAGQAPRQAGAEGRKTQPFLQTPFDESTPKFSPVGHWLAYVSNESGRYEVYVQPYPGPGGKWQISTEGGTEPLWNHNGREIFYRNGNKMMAVEVTTQPGFVVGKPRMLFEGPYLPPPFPFSNYDVTPDGQRFLMVKATGEEQPATQINVVLNWFEELKRRVPAGR